jgi:DNA-binding transcriptional ArsR family regulator
VAANADEAIRALGDPTRRAIFELVADDPMPVGAIAARLPVSRPAVSQHLKVLKEAGLVVDRPAGTRRYYEVDPAGVGALRSYFERFWNTALWSFKNAAEAAAQKEEK